MDRVHNSSKWQRVRRMAWDRDRRNHAPCHICNEKIDYSLQPGTAPLSWEPDHIYPASRFPEFEFDLANLAPSHKACNHARGNGTHDNDLGMRSRIW